MSPEAPDRWELPATVGTALAAAAYLLTTAGRLGLVYYLPVERTWTSDPGHDAIAMDWFFRAAVTFLATGAGVGLGRALQPSNPAKARRWAKLVFGVALSALAWAAVFTVGFLIFPP